MLNKTLFTTLLLIFVLIAPQAISASRLGEPIYQTQPPCNPDRDKNCQ